MVEPGRGGLWWTWWVSSASRRWAAAALLVTVGWFATPTPVAVYDGVGAPDEPYRYVLPPAGAKQTAPPTSASAQSPVAKDLNIKGMSVQTAEQGPQASLFVPPYGLRSAGRTIEVKVAPSAPTDQPAGIRVDGNVYAFTLASPGQQVTLTAQAAVATVYLRATKAAQPGPMMLYRAASSAPWEPLKTSRGGQDVYVSTFPGPGQYALGFVKTSKGTGTTSGGSSAAPYAVGGGIMLLLVVLVVIRLRASPE